MAGKQPRRKPLRLTADVKSDPILVSATYNWPGRQIIIRKCGQDNEASTTGRWRISRDNGKTWEGDFRNESYALSFLRAEIRRRR
jgi:hypothetical protein